MLKGVSVSSDRYPCGLSFPLLIWIFLNFIYPGDSVFCSICLLKREKEGVFSSLINTEEDLSGFLSKPIIVFSQREKSNFLPPDNLLPTQICPVIIKKSDSLPCSIDIFLFGGLVSFRMTLEQIAFQRVRPRSCSL